MSRVKVRVSNSDPQGWILAIGLNSSSHVHPGLDVVRMVSQAGKSQFDVKHRVRNRRCFTLRPIKNLAGGDTHLNGVPGSHHRDHFLNGIFSCEPQSSTVGILDIEDPASAGDRGGRLASVSSAYQQLGCPNETVIGNRGTCRWKLDAHSDSNPGRTSGMRCTRPARSMQASVLRPVVRSSPSRRISYSCSSFTGVTRAILVVNVSRSS